ncbi:MAG: ribose-phosphate diphosphokinase [Candidatus Parcubacteria bacterium]|nr:ribose-phosphate diphosphokinase [Candidatus Parcubacteria bacterium]
MAKQILYYCPQMADLAQKIKALCPDLILGDISWNFFPDGFPNFRINHVAQAKNTDATFLASMDSPAEVFNQLSLIYALPKYLVKSLKVILPFYPTGTMERVETQGEIATAMSLARMLSATPMTQTGPAQIIIYDIHALQEQFYFSDQVLVRLETAADHIIGLFPKDEYDLAFPDDGAYKRFARYFPGYTKIICQKVRDGTKRIIQIKEGNPRGKKVVIIDDLIMSGGTLLECAQKLLDAGALEVLAYATHPVFPDNSWEKFISSNIAKVAITDSCPKTVAAVKGQPKFQIISLAQKIANILTE